MTPRVTLGANTPKVAFIKLPWLNNISMGTRGLRLFRDPIVNSEH
jgi:hypothetical protein